LALDKACLEMNSACVRTVNGLSLPLGPLQEFTSRNDFPEFFASSFPVFALDSHMSELDLEQVAGIANEQARVELGFDQAELREMGYVAAVPQSWQLYERGPPDAVRWYQDEFDKLASSSTTEPQWYPLGFLGITSPDWKNKGVVLVYYDALYGQACDDRVPVKAFVVDPGKIGSTLIGLRQGDTDYESIKEYSVFISSSISYT
jgi:hypothetical protein